MPLTLRDCSEAAKFAAENAKDLGDSMSVTMHMNGEVEETPEQKLWRAVIASTVEEWVNGPLRRKREAEHFLFENEQDYHTVCSSAGINAEDLRRRLWKIRTRQGGEAEARASRN